MSRIHDNLDELEKRIQAACDRSGRKREDVLLIAVTKTVGVPEILQLPELGVTDIGNAMMGKQTNVRSITMATMIVSILPIIIIYPFLQRFFIKGIMIGSIKG